MERAEKIGLGVAATGHVALFGLLSFSLLGGPDESFRPKAIEVMIADDIGLESASPDPAILPPASSVAPELGDPSLEDLPQLEPAPLPDAPRVTPTPAIKEKPKAKAAPKPKTRDKPKGSRLGKDFLKGVTDTASTSSNQNIRAEKASSAAVASLERELYRLVKQKWRPPTGADAEKLRTKVTARLDRSGNIVGTPTATTTGITASNRSQADIHKERAIAAVKLASPYTSFPEKYYEEWQVIEPVLYLGI